MSAGNQKKLESRKGNHGDFTQRRVSCKGRFHAKAQRRSAKTAKDKCFEDAKGAKRST
jgi:hypothetical protein